MKKELPEGSPNLNISAAATAAVVVACVAATATVSVTAEKDEEKRNNDDPGYAVVVKKIAKAVHNLSSLNCISAFALVHNMRKSDLLRQIFAKYYFYFLPSGKSENSTGLPSLSDSNAASMIFIERMS